VALEVRNTTLARGKVTLGAQSSLLSSARTAGAAAGGTWHPERVSPPFAHSHQHCGITPHHTIFLPWYALCAAPNSAAPPGPPHTLGRPAAPLRQDVLQRRQPKSERLAGARRGDADQVAAALHDRPALRLDGRRPHKVARHMQQVIAEACASSLAVTALAWCTRCRTR